MIKEEDTLLFSIDGVKNTAMKLRELNKENKDNKEKFSSYIKDELEPEWVTEEGKNAIIELKKFVDDQFLEYIRYLDGKIDDIEEIVVPALQAIDKA